MLLTPIFFNENEKFCRQESKLRESHWFQVRLLYEIFLEPSTRNHTRLGIRLVSLCFCFGRTFCSHKKWSEDGWETTGPRMHNENIPWVAFAFEMQVYGIRENILLRFLNLHVQEEISDGLRMFLGHLNPLCGQEESDIGVRDISCSMHGGLALLNGTYSTERFRHLSCLCGPCLWVTLDASSFNSYESVFIFAEGASIPFSSREIAALAAAPYRQTCSGIRPHCCRGWTLLIGSKVLLFILWYATALSPSGNPLCRLHGIVVPSP